MTRDFPATSGRRATALLLLTIGAAMLVQAAAAEPVWQPPTVVAPGYGSEAELFVGRGGEATIVWQTFIGCLLDCEDATLATWRKDALSGWSTPTELRRSGLTSLAVGGNRKGDVALAWWSGHDLMLRRKLGGSQAWGDPVVVTSAGFLRVDAPVVTIGPAGDIALAWSAADVCGGRCLNDPHVVVLPAGSDHAEDVQLEEELSIYNVTPSVSIDAAGNALAVWPVLPTPGIPRLHSSYRPAGGEWQQMVEIAAGGPYTYAPQTQSMAMNDAGDAVVAWTYSGPNGQSDQGTVAIERPAGGVWSRVARIDAERLEHPKLGIAENGDALVTWRAATAVYSSSYIRGRGWFPTVVAAKHEPREFNDEGPAEAMAVAPNGNAVVIWNERRLLKAAVKPAGSSAWSAPIEVTDRYRDFGRLAFDVDGHATALWTAYQSDGDRSDLVTSSLSDSGPVITSFTTPERFRARQSVRFSVAAYPWSTALAGRPRWSFGDGTSAIGERVRHAYRRAGSYRVTVTVSDTAGAVATRRTRVRVLAGLSGRHP